MFPRLLAIAGLFLSPLGAWAISSSGSSVLVVLEPKLNRDDYSQFFNGLERMHWLFFCLNCGVKSRLNKFTLLLERGFNLTFRAPKDLTPAVAEYGVSAFSHVVLFTPTTKSKYIVPHAPLYYLF